jgi:excisionase family DNA binding protein
MITGTLQLPKYYYKPEDVAELLNISKPQVTILREKGELKCIRHSERVVRFSPEQVAEYLDKVGDSTSAALVRQQGNPVGREVDASFGKRG